MTMSSCRHAYYYDRKLRMWVCIMHPACTFTNQPAAVAA